MRGLTFSKQNFQLYTKDFVLRLNDIRNLLRWKSFHLFLPCFHFLQQWVEGRGDLEVQRSICYDYSWCLSLFWNWYFMLLIFTVKDAYAFFIMKFWLLDSIPCLMFKVWCIMEPFHPKYLFFKGQCPNSYIYVKSLKAK